MDAIQQARKLFLKCHHHQASLKEIDKHFLGRDIQRFITIAIKEATSKDLFENPCVLDMLKSALKQREYENSDVMPVARAFQNLEKYFLLLVEQPWKAEFREIKLYGGFYRTKVKAMLPDCESVFEHAGYMVLPESSIMIYKGPMNKTSLLLLAFDCRVGQVECQTIAEHYNKVKGLSMSLGDAISNILHDEYSRDKPAQSYHLNKSNGMVVNLPPVSNVIAPPALPKREPIINSSNVQPYVRNESEYGIYKDMVDNRLEAGIALPPKSPSRTSDFYSSVLSRPSLTPLSAAAESFTYIDAQTDEILPELPKGTSEDHMLESLRHFTLQNTPRQQLSDGRKQLNVCRDSKNIPSSTHLNYITPAAYSVNGLSSGSGFPQGQYKPGPTVDEGIEPDLPSSKSYSSSSKYNYTGGQQVLLPTRNMVNFQQPYFEQGYRTAADGIYTPPAISGMHNPQHTIYQPPSIATDGPSPGQLAKTFVSSVPPPVPSRALKPKPVNSENCLQTRVYMSVPNYASGQPGGVDPIQNESLVNRPLVSAPGYSTIPQMYNTERVLHKDRLALSKTNSLKTDEAITPLSQVRAARSMDMASVTWQCQSCTTINMASNVICFSCSHSRLGPDVSQPVIGETKKACSSCTYANSPDRAHCEICGSILHDKFTFV